MSFLSTRYLGLDLETPLVASAGPLSQTVDGIKALADAGVGAVVMYSLFEEQIRAEEARNLALEMDIEDSFAEATSYFPVVPRTGTQVDAHSAAYLKLLEDAAKAVDVPVIASLNGSTTGGWIRFARRMQDAGASALELNIYFVPGDLTASGDEVENRHLEILVGVKDAVSIPVAVKLSPYFSSFGSLALQLDEAGADGLVMFNRFFQPEVNIETFQMVPGVELSTPFDGRLPRTWIAALHGRVKASLAGTGGVATSEDVVRYLLAGADVVMTTSALVRNGVSYAATLQQGLVDWLNRHQMTVAEARGKLAIPTDVSADDYERQGYVAALQKAKETYGSLTGN
ncbi:MAG TPA: dihydroorotate dehydrogenase-like protein [Propionibacteriaceae bacterium]|nr:dihydroorotate dehydrogenase-like protein [Propionibacteriaceae bacterium]HPZ48721.1 dihydroorotate dehydrogenase-like protein [Propionibacteriaceae bacterium]